MQIIWTSGKGFDMGMVKSDGTFLQLTDDHDAQIGTFSPDGRYLYFSGTVESEQEEAGTTKGKRENIISQISQISRLDLKTGQVTRISDGSGDDELPACSPDGKQLAFVSRPVAFDSEEPWKLYLMDTDGKNRRLLDPDTPGNQGYPSWSPDGTKIVYAYLKTQLYGCIARGVLKVRDLKKNTTTNLTGLFELCSEPSWSPDGKHIAYIAFTYYGKPTKHIWVMRSDGSDKRQLTTGPEDQQPVWSPDGRQVLFNRPDGGNRKIFAVDVTTREVKKLFELPGASLVLQQVQLDRKVDSLAEGQPKTGSRGKL
ncbi:MAG: hypothetical protein PHX53_00925 [Syntrophales bacterium]|nr:hypothetical protein [Syntrophales bacterium]